MPIRIHIQTLSNYLLNAEPDFESTRLDEVLETLPCASTRGSEDLFPEHAPESTRLQEHSETSSVTRASEVLIPDCEESSIEEPDIVDCSIDDCPPTIAYEVIEDSTKRAVASPGFSNWGGTSFDGR